MLAFLALVAQALRLLVSPSNETLVHIVDGVFGLVSLVAALVVLARGLNFKRIAVFVASLSVISYPLLLVTKATHGDAVQIAAPFVTLIGSIFAAVLPTPRAHLFVIGMALPWSVYQAIVALDVLNLDTPSDVEMMDLIAAVVTLGAALYCGVVALKAENAFVVEATSMTGGFAVAGLVAAALKVGLSEATTSDLVFVAIAVILGGLLTWWGHHAQTRRQLDPQQRKDEDATVVAAAKHESAIV
ncbi:Aste57867_12087 [Aphanomyces stellatus]|uniref:Aste57867_12087 protein n=1 Tax=Aphanomyces stellatus TaxID=120398 RepID=A0A485KUM7_9STRA|nr:hypothetical protein As57867_012042 [Aphanomyces stellatus]VFT88942.1 Aste57867_12087 [Aphanomyces stellatus]